MRTRGSQVSVLYVDEDAEGAELGARMLEREDDRFVVEAVADATTASSRIRDEAVDCVVCCDDGPGRNGFELLEAIRGHRPELPVVLFVADGSEAFASDAISAGVTEYVRRDGTVAQFERLADGVASAVEQPAVEAELERQRDLLERTQAIANVGAWEYDVASETTYVTEEVRRIHGVDPGTELDPEASFEHYHPEDRDAVREAFEAAIRDGESYDLTVRLVAGDGSRRWVRTRGEPQLRDGEVVRVRGILQDVTEQHRRERRLERRNDRLEEFANIVSHDIRSPLNVASGHLERAAETGDEAAFEDVRQSHDRIETIVEDVLELARQGKEIGATESVPIADVARDAWQSVETDAITLRTLGDCRVQADATKLKQLFENLFRNSVEHNSTGNRTQSGDNVEHGSTGSRPQADDDVEDGDVTVTVSVGPIESLLTTTRSADEGVRGFYVQDDGSGIPESDRDAVFDPGYSTAEDGTGFGLSIVEQIAEAHGWSIRVTEGVDGGARFEITDVAVSDDDTSVDAH